MTDVYWKHFVRCTVAGIIIEDPKISFRILRQIDGTAPEGYIALYNLNTDTEQRIHEKGADILLEAGWENTGNLGLIFDGSVGKIERERNDLSRITRIKISGKAVQPGPQKRTNGSVFRGYDADGVTYKQIITDIVEDMELELGPLDAVPDGTRTWNFVGSGTSALDQVCQSADITWYEDDGVIRFSKAGRNTEQPDAETVTIDQNIGLIGTPAILDNGARIRMFLNNRIRLGGVLTVESETLTGTYKVVAVQHSGDNWTGPLYTDVELRENE